MASFVLNLKYRSEKNGEYRTLYFGTTWRFIIILSKCRLNNSSIVLEYLLFKVFNAKFFQIFGHNSFSTFPFEIGRNFNIQFRLFDKRCIPIWAWISRKTYSHSTRNFMNFYSDFYFGTDNLWPGNGFFKVFDNVT